MRGWMFFLDLPLLRVQESNTAHRWSSGQGVLCLALASVPAWPYLFGPNHRVPCLDYLKTQLLQHTLHISCQAVLFPIICSSGCTCCRFIDWWFSEITFMPWNIHALGGELQKSIANSRGYKFFCLRFMSKYLYLKYRSLAFKYRNGKGGY